MEYRLNKESLLTIISGWNAFLKKEIHLIACGGTALTLLGVKPSTKDVDFIVPVEKEHDYLIEVLQKVGYGLKTGSGWSKDNIYIFDLYKGNKVHTTELLKSPLEEGNNILLKEFSHIYVGILNYYDIITSKLFRGTGADFDDCLLLVKAKKEEINIERLKKHFLETASYDTSEEKVRKNLDSLLRIIKKKGIYGK